MTKTTIPTEFRDQINSGANALGCSTARCVESLVDREDRRIRMESLGAAIRANTPDEQYWQEFAELDLIGGGIFDA